MRLPLILPRRTVTLPPKARIASFVVAVLVTTALGSILQTQINLAELQALGAPVPVDVRLRTTGQDLLGFTPAYAGLVTASFLVSLPAAAWVARRRERRPAPIEGRRVALPPPGAPGPGRAGAVARVLLHAVAAAAGLAVAFQVADAVAPMPTLIAATRSLAGTALLLIGAGIGGSVFAAWPARRKRVTA